MTTKPAVPTVEEMIRSHQDGVWRFLVSIGCEAHMAEDITQETFLSVLRGGFDYRGDKETVALLLRVAKHRFIDALRKRDAIPDTDLVHAETRWQEFNEQCGYEQRVQWLRECIDTLGGRAREAVKQRYELNLPREEMAQRLSITPAGVKTLLGRVRQALRDCVQSKVDHDRA